MSSPDLDLEKQPMVSVTPLSPDSSKRLSALDTYQLLVGNIDKPVDVNDDSLYHAVVAEERKSKYLYILSGVLIYTCIAAQIILCLGIAIGARHFRKETISILAAINTGVAASIGVLKALGLPDKKAVERRKLQQLADRIRTTTRKLRAGFDVDALAEADVARQTYEQTEEEAHLATAGIPVKAPSDIKVPKK